MNVPGEAAGNWRWRLPPGKLTEKLAGRLLNLTEISDRRPAPEGRGGPG
jgi:4-alpha-glucanotransferase